jgi:hypothetical protein
VHRPDRRCNVVDAEPAGEDHAAALCNFGSALPVDCLADTALHAFIKEHVGEFPVDTRVALADDRPALDVVRHVERLEVVDVRLQHVGRERLEYLLPFLGSRVTHHRDALHPFRQVLCRPDRVGRFYPADGFRENEANGISAGPDGRLDVVGVAQTTNLYHQAHRVTPAAPASRIAAINAAGSSLRISAVPTSATR